MNPVASPFDAVRDAPREWIPTLLYKKIFTIALRALSLIALLQSSFITAGRDPFLGKLEEQVCRFKEVGGID